MSARAHRPPAGLSRAGHDTAGAPADIAALEHELERERVQFREALSSRDLIGQAKGILMERYGLDEDAAFALLTRYSRTSNQALRGVAADLVRRRALPTL